MSKTKKPKEKEKVTNEKPVSLYPLSLEEALEALLRTKPKEKKKRTRKETKKSSD